MIDPEKIISIPESERWLFENPEVGGIHELPLGPFHSLVNKSNS